MRHAEGEDTLREGEIVCFPAGPAGGHKVTNKSTQTARVVMFSNVLEPAMTVYPDSSKLGAFDKPSATRLLFRIGDAVDYYEGEIT